MTRSLRTQRGSSVPPGCTYRTRDEAVGDIARRRNLEEPPFWRAVAYTAGQADGRRSGYAAGLTEGHTEGWQRGYTAGQLDAPASLDPGLVADLVQLAHPDRHPPERADLAHRATVQLLAVRERSK
ncbi:MAG: Yae1 family protein, partial [Solirubrobacteraceae bacterium]